MRLRSLPLRTFVVVLMVMVFGLVAQPPGPARAHMLSVISEVGECTHAHLQQEVDFVMTGPPEGEVRFEVDCEIELDDGTGPLILTVPAGKMLTIDANGHDVVFDGNNLTGVMTFSGEGELTLSGLTVKNGKALLGGAGVRVLAGAGSLTVAQSAFAWNEASGSGGAIFSEDGEVAVTRSTFTGNTSRTFGGAIRAQDVLSITDSTFTNNSADMCGALSIDGGSATVKGSTFARNEVRAYAAAICSDNSDFYLINSTITENTIQTQGGAVAILGDPGSTQDTVITNSTIANNPRGGVINSLDSILIRNSILFGSSLGSDVNSFVGNSTVENSVVGTTNGPVQLSFTTSVDPELGDLQDNGGPTETMGITRSSSAFDLGNPTYCDGSPGEPLYGADGKDQRGFTRESNCSAGAFEPDHLVDLTVNGSAIPSTVTAGSGSENLLFEISLKNNGETGATNIKVGLDLTLPAVATLANVSHTANSGPSFFNHTTAPDGEWTIPGPLGPGTSEKISIWVTVGSSAVAGSQVSLTGTVLEVDQLESELADNMAMVSSTVEVVHDMAATVSGPSTAFAGATHTYTVEVTNNGPSDAANVVLEIVTPIIGTVAISQGGSPAFSLSSDAFGRVTGTVASFPAGQVATFTYDVPITSSVPKGAVVNNTVEVTADPLDRAPGNNWMSLDVVIDTGADLAVTKSGPAMVAGMTATYVVALTNNGPSDAANVSLVESIPAGTTPLGMVQLAGPAFVITATPGGWTAEGPVLPAAQQARFLVDLAIPADMPGGTKLTNTVTASTSTPETNTGNNSASVTGTVKAVSDLVITKATEGVGPVLAGTELTYVLELVNNGPSSAASAKVSDLLPAGVTFVSASVTGGDGWSKTEPAVGGTGTVSFTKAMVAAGETASFEIVVKINSNLAANTRLSNTATVSSASQAVTPANGSDSAVVTVMTESDVWIRKESSPEAPVTVAPGGTITYTVTVGNTGPSDVRNVRVTDVLPAGTRFVSAQVSGAGWVITQKPSPGGTGSVVFSSSQFVSGAEATLTVVVKVNPTVAHGTVIKNTATIGSAIAPGSTAKPTPDAVPGNNAATVEVTVGTGPVSAAAGVGGIRVYPLEGVYG